MNNGRPVETLFCSLVLNTVNNNKQRINIVQDFNSECSDVSQLDLKLQCAQEQLKIQNRQLFKQYLENLLANKNLQEYIRLIHLIMLYLIAYYLQSYID